MTDEEYAKALYEEQASKWPNPIGWDKLSKVSKKLWTDRARQKLARLFDPYSRH